MVTSDNNIDWKMILETLTSYRTAHQKPKSHSFRRAGYFEWSCVPLQNFAIKPQKEAAPHTACLFNTWMCTEQKAIDKSTKTKLIVSRLSWC